MLEEEIPDLNVFMMCEHLNEKALRAMPKGFHIRPCRKDELHVWKAFPFDTEELAREYNDFMTSFFYDTYGHSEELFFRNTLFVCDHKDMPVATCSSWKAYGKFESIHWFKTLKSYEGKGLGRALFSVIMERFSHNDYPVYLHTQPASFRAIKLYSDFGFKLLSGQQFGHRPNHLNEYLPILKQFMPAVDFENLMITEAPEKFLKLLENETTIQF